MSVKVYTQPDTARTWSIQVVASYEGIELDLSTTVKPYSKEEERYQEFIKEFPIGKVPAIKHGEFKLTETLAILVVSGCLPPIYRLQQSHGLSYIVPKPVSPWKPQYLAKLNNKASLLGKTPEEEASVLQWAAWANSDLLPGYVNWLSPLLGRQPFNKALSQDSEARCHRNYKILDDHLATRTFLVGHRVTLADIMVAAVYGRGAAIILDKAFRAEHPNVLRFYQTVANQPQYLAVVPPVTLIEVRQAYTAPKKEKEPKAPAAAPAAPKAEKKKAEKEKDADEEDDDAKPEPKPKHACDLLPAPTSFPLDEWKRQYSNNDTPVAFEWFQKNFNAQDYSLWKVSYKYNDELTQVFMSSNLITGFHNRLEGSRKYLFGSSGVYGENNNSKIQGAYMLRGADFKPVFEVAPDYESYEFTPLDLEKDKEFILGCWAWTNECDGLKYADGKVFK